MRFFVFGLLNLFNSREEINSDSKEYLEYRGTQGQDIFHLADDYHLSPRFFYRLTRY